MATFGGGGGGGGGSKIDEVPVLRLGVHYNIMFNNKVPKIEVSRNEMGNEKQQAHRQGGFEGVRANPPFGPQKILYTLLNCTF